MFIVVEWDELFSLQSPDTESRNHINEERLRSLILCLMKLEIQRLGLSWVIELVQQRSRGEEVLRKSAALDSEAEILGPEE